MNAAADILNDLARRGLSIRVEPDGLHIRPAEKLTDELRARIKENRPALIQALQDRQQDGQAPDTSMSFATALQASPPSRSEQRRLRVLAMLEDSPDRLYAVLVDDSDPEYQGRFVLALALRQDGELYTVELLIAADRYDGLAILELSEKHARRTLH